MRSKQELRDLNRLATFIDKNSLLYFTDKTFQLMADNTQFITEEQRRESLAYVGETYGV